MTEELKERVIKLEGRIDGHEALCAERYDRILEKLKQFSIPKMIGYMTAIFTLILGLFTIIITFLT